MKNENAYQLSSSREDTQSQGAYQHSPSSYPATFSVSQSGASPPSQQYFADTFHQTSPQFLKTESQEYEPYRELSPPGQAVRSSPECQQVSPGYLWPDQHHQYDLSSSSWSSGHQQPAGGVTVMVLNEDGTLDRKFTVPNDVLSDALISPTSASVPASVPASACPGPV